MALDAARTEPRHVHVNGLARLWTNLCPCARAFPARGVALLLLAGATSPKAGGICLVGFWLEFDLLRQVMAQIEVQWQYFGPQEALPLRLG